MPVSWPFQLSGRWREIFWLMWPEGFLARHVCNPRTQEDFKLEASLKSITLQKPTALKQWSKHTKKFSLLERGCLERLNISWKILPQWYFFLGSAQGQNSGMKYDYVLVECVCTWSSMGSDLFMLTHSWHALCYNTVSSCLHPNFTNI